MANTLVPRLRFPEFRDAPQWELKALGEVSVRLQERVGDDILTPVSISAGVGFVSQQEKFGRDISGAQYRNYVRLRTGDFSYNKGNSKRYPQGCVYVLKEFEEAAVPNVFVSFRVREGYVAGFLQPQFEMNRHGRQLIRFITSGARGDGLLNISPDEFFSVQLPFPPNEAEQKKIAECLNSLDELIAAEGRKLEALRIFKKGLLQNLFPRPERTENGVKIPAETTPRLRFPEFHTDGEWSEIPLGRVTSESNTRVERTLPASCVMGVTKADGIVPMQERLIGADVARYKLLRTDWFAYNPMRLNIGSIARYFGTEDVAVSPDYIVFKCLNVSDGGILPDYLDQFRWSERWSRFATRGHNLGVRIRIYYENLAELRVPLPKKSAEQQRIASCLSSLDALIAAQSKKLDTLKTHKQGLMQGLFPSTEKA